MNIFTIAFFIYIALIALVVIYFTYEYRHNEGKATKSVKRTETPTLHPLLPSPSIVSTPEVYGRYLRMSGKDKQMARKRKKAHLSA